MRDTPITRDTIAEDLRRLGARDGDVLYLRCGLSRLGSKGLDIRNIFLEGIWDAIGAKGTIVTPSFIKASLRWVSDPVVSCETTPPNTGAFAKLILAQPGAIRSAHPTHSFAGVGKRAREILCDHSSNTACFEPVRKLVALNALMAVVGCVETSPGFSTVHLAQHDLGLSQQHYTKWFIKVREGSSDGPVFHPLEAPGCSNNFGVFYKDYVEAENFETGYVGNAWSVAVRAAGAYETELRILKEDPLYPLCDDLSCLSCYALRGYNKRGMPGALIRNLAKRVFR